MLRCNEQHNNVRRRQEENVSCRRNITFCRHACFMPAGIQKWKSKSTYLTSCQQLTGWPFNVCVFNVCVCAESLNTHTHLLNKAEQRQKQKETAGLRFNLIIYTGNKKAVLYSRLLVEKWSDVKYENVCKAKMQKEEERIEMSKCKLDKRLSETAESVDIRSSESSCWRSDGRAEI